MLTSAMQEVRVDKLKESSTYYPFRGTFFDDNGKVVPLNQQIWSKDRHAYTPAGNVFVVGFMLYQFLTLDDPIIMSKFLDRIMQEKTPQPDTLLSRTDMDQRREVLDNYAAAYNGTGLTNTETRNWEHLYDEYLMLERWESADYNPSLKNLVEQCMAFLPEERISAADLLAQLEALLPNYWQTLKEMRRLDPGEHEKTTKAFTTEADLPQMDPGNLQIDLDANFWKHLVKTCKFLDTDLGNIWPRMDPDDTNVPQEARDMFAPARKQKKNQFTAKQGRDTNSQATNNARDLRFLRMSQPQVEDPDDYRKIPSSSSDHQSVDRHLQT